MAHSSAEIFEFLSDAHQYKKWIESKSDDEDDLAHAKKMIRVAIEEELTERQAEFFHMYFLAGRTVTEIARLAGANKSTVSRTLALAKKKIFRCVRYSSPRLCHAPVQKRNRRIYGKR